MRRDHPVRTNIRRARRWLKYSCRALLLRAARDPHLTRLIPDFYQKEIEREAEPRQFRLSEEMRVRIHPRAAKAFEYFTFRDRQMIEEMDCFVRATHGRTCLLDIGALYGVFSLAFASRPNALAIACEPSYPAFQTLAYHVDANPGFEITPVQVAIGETQGRIRMSYEWEHLIVNESPSWNQDHLSVEVTTVDNLLTRYPVTPDTVKIDVEGFERIDDAVACLSNTHEVGPTSVSRTICSKTSPKPL